ncbi:unnamed protein product (mitochondrion) [Plasmodiophora brassicae]|uniref:Uncharacterized protein n=1 Tax=Plasmodiophora brassicae TaxID=37360 RepID=A0A0G4IYK1_PLABS|nr:hypothetical protein PBRA_008071 [Plasmodiophora brassicae]SPQ95114.1 unnamed protein product [Plasmodiophora brassicae]
MVVDGDGRQRSLRNAIRWTPGQSFLNRALLFQVVAILLFVFHKVLHRYAVRMGLNNILWTGVVLRIVCVAFWIVHVIHRLFYSTKTYMSLKYGSVSTAQANSLMKRYAMSAPVMAISITAKLNNGDTGVLFRSFSYDHWNNVTMIDEDLQWPDGLSIVHIVESIEPGNSYTKTRLEVQRSRAEIAFRRQYGNRFTIDEEVQQFCAPLDETRCFVVKGRNATVTPIYLTPWFYLAVAVVGLSAIWELVLQCLANKLEVDVCKRIYIDEPPPKQFVMPVKVSPAS